MPGKGNKGGGGGSSGGGDDPVIGKIIWGTEQSERLGGSKGDDVFHGLGGDDILSGGDGTDTAVYEGSVWDYTWNIGFKSIWTVTDTNPADGDSGSDELKSVEYLQFDDATILLGGVNLPVVEAPDQLTTYADQTASIELRVMDFDDVSLSYSRVYGDVLEFNPRFIIHETARKGMGSYVEMTIEFFPNPGFDDLLAPLAVGESMVESFTFRFGSFGEYTDHVVELTILGVNDAPTLAPGALIEMTEDDAPHAFDLSAFGDDIDSDDDGTTLTYRILEAPAEFDVSTIGDKLVFDPNPDFQYLDSGDRARAKIIVQAEDQHGAVSESQEFFIWVHGVDEAGDPTPLYLTSGGAIDYGRLGVDPTSAPSLGTLNGLVEDPAYLDLIAFTDGDDVRVINVDWIEFFGSHEFLYESAGITAYSDLTFDTGDGDDVLVFYQRAYQTNFEGIDISTGSGEDVVVIDAKSDADSAVQAINVSTGDHDDQVLVTVESPGSSHAVVLADFHLGRGNDQISIELTDTDGSNLAGLTNFNGDIHLGSGRNWLSIDVNAKNALWADLNVDITAGNSADYVSLSNGDSDLPANYPYPWAIQVGLEGGINLGGGDDVLDLDIIAFDNGYVHEAQISGGDGYDVANLLNGDRADFTIAEDGWGGYIVTYAGQQMGFNGFEEINARDGDLLDLVA